MTPKQPPNQYPFSVCLIMAPPSEEFFKRASSPVYKQMWFNMKNVFAEGQSREQADNLTS
jgi:hypothetical protein